MCGQTKIKFARLSEVNEGTVLVADGGFTCITEGTEVVVRRDKEHGLFIPCDDGKHFLDGQCDDHSAPDAHYVGLHLKAA